VTRVWQRIDTATAVGLAAFGVLLVSGLAHDNTRHAGALAAAFVLLMTAPVAWRRKAPVAVAAVLAAGAVLNWAVVGPMIRCGPGLPALLLCAYAVGRYEDRISRAGVVAALACLLAAATVQCLTDPNLHASVMVALTPMILGLFGVGVLVQSRSRMAVELARRNDELRSQRARRADLAVEADRIRIAEALDADLNARIVEMATVAADARQGLGASAPPSAASEAFTSIQQQGRETLSQMRRVVGTLLDPDPPEVVPQPSLSQLDALLRRGEGADVRLHITGTPTALPSGLELSAYRTLERLLDAYGNDPGQHIDIDVDFGNEALCLRTSGPAPEAVDRDAALASARARVELHRGSIVGECPGDRWETSVTLPLRDSA
jgi:signal transduction histidine kinase